MKTSIVIVILVTFTAILFELVGMWWGMSIGGLIIGLLVNLNWWRGMATTFIAGFLYWLLASLWFYMNGSELIAQRIAELIQVPSAMVLILIASIISGILGLLGFCMGQSIRLLMRPSANPTITS